MAALKGRDQCDQQGLHYIQYKISVFMKPGKLKMKSEEQWTTEEFIFEWF